MSCAFDGDGANATRSFVPSADTTPRSTLPADSSVTTSAGSRRFASTITMPSQRTGRVSGASFFCSITRCVIACASGCSSSSNTSRSGTLENLAIEDLAAVFAP